MGFINYYNRSSNDGKFMIKFTAFLLYVYIYNRMPFYKSAKLIYCGIWTYVLISLYVLFSKLFFNRDNSAMLFLGMVAFQFFITWFCVRLYVKYHDQDLVLQMSVNFWFFEAKKKLVSPWWQYFAAFVSYWMIKGWVYGYCILNIQEDRDLGKRHTKWFWFWYTTSWFPLIFYLYIFINTIY